MTSCTEESFEFPRVSRHVVEASFDGGEIDLPALTGPVVELV